jgi:hypothetical protein
MKMAPMDDPGMGKNRDTLPRWLKDGYLNERPSIAEGGRQAWHHAGCCWRAGWGRGARPDPAFMAKRRAHEAEIVALLSAKSEPDIPASSATAERDVAPALASIPAHGSRRRGQDR